MSNLRYALHVERDSSAVSEKMAWAMVSKTIIIILLLLCTAVCVCVCVGGWVGGCATASNTIILCRAVCLCICVYVCVCVCVLEVEEVYRSKL